MAEQLPLERPIFIYECPVGCHRYWDANPHLDPDADHGHDLHLFCERCGRACHRVGSFTVSPFDPASFPDEDDLPLDTDTSPASDH